MFCFQSQDSGVGEGAHHCISSHYLELILRSVLKTYYSIKVTFEKHKVTPLLKNYAALYGAQRIITSFTKNQQCYQ